MARFGPVARRATGHKHSVRGRRGKAADGKSCPGRGRPPAGVAAALRARRLPLAAVVTDTTEDFPLRSLDWQQGVLDPHGPIAAAERTILLNATVIMLAVIVPVIVMTIAFAWWFRAGNRRAKRDPEWAYSGAVEVTVWSIPALIILFLGGICWIGSHDLDPGRPLASRTPPVTVQVVSLDWKWLFIYPELGVASVNRLVVPVGAPLRLKLTSATVMNSFFVPQLGSQIYTMGGMTTSLHLRADHPGTYFGLSANFSGDGFSDMRFDTVALPPADFDRWLASARTSPRSLDAAGYADLARPAVAAAPVTFSHVAPDLFETILARTAGPASALPGMQAMPGMHAMPATGG